MVGGKTTKFEKRRGRIGWAFIAPALVLIGIFYIYPIMNSLYLSTQSGKGVVMEYAGFGNIVRLFNDAMFKEALKNTFIFFIFQVPIMLSLAMFVSILLNDKDLKFKGFFRTAIFLPAVTSLVAYSILFKSIFSSDGIMNTILLNWQIIQEPISWLSDSFWAKVTVILAITWRWTGYNMIFYLSGLQNIDPAIYEAARIDGANKFKQFTAITVPMMRPIILFTSIMSTIGTLQLFDEVMNLTGSGNSSLAATITLSQYIYDLSFRFVPNFGYAATVSYVIVIIIAFLGFIQFKIGGKDNA